MFFGEVKAPSCARRVYGQPGSEPFFKFPPFRLKKKKLFRVDSSRFKCLAIHHPLAQLCFFFFFHNFSLWTKSPDVFEVTVLFRKGRSVYVAKSVFIKLTHCFWGARYSAVLKFVNHFVLKKYLFYIMFFFIHKEIMCGAIWTRVRAAGYQWSFPSHQT